ncbi:MULTISPECIES: hypothetical protein [Actinosynnema]|uniref:hypothetical protein n=1 Tax=Actinosynnema TaxID=40566 RepID=UPI0020A3ABBF|nr:hypothetical protein [Actinosynnema pretiosum]MCP2094694.1 hypothetical protein [Actinosynnema pretiosum]
MTVHYAADPSATGPAVFPAGAAWLTLSAALADQTPVIADREDLLVSIAPGAGGGTACFYPARALIEINGDHLGVDPATVDPADIGDRARYAPTWGALVHECGHARHSVWDPPPGTPAGVAGAADLLEEPRMEAAQVRRRPDDRHWLRACARAIVAADLHLFADPATAPQMTRRDAATTATLLVGRADAGILTRAEVAALVDVARDVVGAKDYGRLERVWRAALRVADDDADTMIDLGRQWCGIVGVDPDTGRPDPGTTPGSAGAPAPPGGVGVPSVLAGVVAAVLDGVAANAAREVPPLDPAAVAAAATGREKAAADAARRVAKRVFGRGGVRDGRTSLRGTRKPTDGERMAARVLGRALDTAGVRERVAVRTGSEMPPGRVRMRGVRAAEAQRAAGAVVTAEQFTRVTRRVVPVPPLRLGVACDVSGTMGSVRDHVASAAWVLAEAVHHTRVPAQAATVIFGHHVRPLTGPGDRPPVVTQFDADDNWEDIPGAVDAVDGVLGLSRPGAARLLVVISDGDFRPVPRRDGQDRIDRLRATGCAVLWLTTHTDDTPLAGVSVHLLTDPATTATAIGRAATAALRAAAH